MKPALAIPSAAVLAASAFGQSAAPAPQLLRTQTAFDLTVRLPYTEAAPLFGAEGERLWASSHWNPQFVYPRPAHDEQGAVFTVQHGSVTATWIATLFDLEARHFQYAYFIPGIMVTVIDVRFTSVNASSTGVHVIYTRTALTPEGSDHVTAFTATDKTTARDWQQSIDNYLASRKN